MAPLARVAPLAPVAPSHPLHPSHPSHRYNRRMRKDPRVDAYIAKANDFAKPILKQIRAAVHKGHPAATETIKWGVPAYVDERGILCMTPAFKRHCAWVF